MNKKEGLKKLKFYNKVLLISFISLTIFIILRVFFENLYIQFETLILFLIIIFILIPIGIISWGMLYHMAKRKNWVLFVLTILFGGWIFSLIYFFAVMRKAFKKGEGIYD